MNSNLTKTPPNYFLIAAGIFLLASIITNVFTTLKQQSVENESITPVANLVARQLADSSAPLVLSDDLISLQALTRKIVEHDNVNYVAIYDLHNNLLSQSGRSSFANLGIQARAEVSIQSQLLGYVSLSIAPPVQPFIGPQLLSAIAAFAAVLTGLLYLQSRRTPAETISNEAKQPRLMQSRQRLSSYQHLAEPQGNYAIIAVELLQLPLMRRQLSENTLYEYLYNFEHWLQLIAQQYDAQIRVGDTGFTLVMDESQNPQSASLGTQCCYLSFTLIRVLNEANKLRNQTNKPVFEARIGSHISTPLNGEAKLLKQLYAQDAHRQAWQSCKGKLGDTVSMTPSVVGNADKSKFHFSEPDINSYCELTQLEEAALEDVNHQVSRLIAKQPIPQETIST